MNRVRSGFARFLGLALWTIASIAAAQVPKVFESPVPVPAEFFGMHIHRAVEGTEWPSVPFGSWRFWDSRVRWRDIEVAPGQYRWEKLDAQVRLAESRGVEIVYTFSQTPLWASSRPNDDYVYGKGAGAMPTDIRLWERFVEAVVTRYKGRIRNYEIQNEPKFTDFKTCGGVVFFCGSIKDLVQLTGSASAVIRRVDPAARVVSPPLTHGRAGLAWLQAFLEQGGGQYVDVIAYHLYEAVPEDALLTVWGIRSTLSRYGLEQLPIWNTEVGYLIQNQDGSVKPSSPSGPFAKVHSTTDAGGLLARVMITQAAAGLQRVFWYSWESKDMGSLGTADKRPTEVAQAYTTVINWLVGAAVQCTGQHYGASYACRVRKDGKDSWAVWARQGASEWRPPFNSSGTVWNLDGSRRSFNRWPLPLGEQPVLVSLDRD